MMKQNTQKQSGRSSCWRGILFLAIMLTAAVFFYGCSLEDGQSDQASLQSEEDLTAYFLDVGQADSTLLVSQGEAVLIATGWDRHLGAPDYFTAHPVVSEAVASLLISKNIRILGLDTPSPDLPPFAVHRRLSEAGIFLAENLRGLCTLYEAAREQVFTFYAVPLKISAEASPIRAFAVLS